MISEAIDTVVGLATKTRPALLQLPDNSGRILLYDDDSGIYREVERYFERRRQVSSIGSFVSLVAAEIDRNRKVKGAEWPTVIFTQEGGAFHLDDRDGRTTFGFKRALAPAYLRLVAGIGQSMEHLSFIRFLQGLRENIADPQVIAAYRKVVFDNSVRVDSQPLLTNGQVGAGYHVELTAKSGALEVTLPDVIALNVPWSRGGAPYRAELAVDITLVQRGEKGVPMFSLAWPEHQSFCETAMNDEIAAFREMTKDIADLVVLENL